MNVIVTAGPTREFIDPVRFISNPSTGKMGFALAAEARRRGHAVTLIAGPVTLKTPAGVRRVDVVSAREMLACVETALVRDLRRGSTVLISTAAIADWRPLTYAPHKLKKAQMDGILHLTRNPDILKTISRRADVRGNRNVRLVGFAAETNNVLSEASRKCREKGLSFIVANDVTRKGSGFGTATDQVTFVFPDGRLRRYPLMSKRRVATQILKELECAPA